MSISGTLTLDTSRFNRALSEFAKYSKKGGQELLFDAARGFVRRVIAISPPAHFNSGTAISGAKAKAAGEAAIAADLSRIMSPGSTEFIGRFKDFWGGSESRELFGHKGAAALGFTYTRVLEKGDLAGWHEERRRGDGRVMQVNRGATTGLKVRDLRGLDIGLVESGTYAWFKKRVQARVGILASGWNRAARRLGYKPPKWIARHGEGRGDVSIIIGQNVFRVIISNEVKFAGNVKGLRRRVQRALDEQGEAMERKVRHFLAKAGKRSGFK